MRSAPLLCALTCAALLAGSSVARAADSGEVERLIRQGVELRMKHDDQQALPLFQKAYGMAATPRTAAQLGLVELSLGYLLESERHLTESLAATHDVWVKRNRPALERSLTKVKARIGELQIKGSPTGADVKLNGTVVGKLPLEAPLRIGEGPANIEVTAPGFKTASHSLAVTGGKRSTWAVELERERPAAVASTASALQPPPETASAATLPLPAGGPLQAAPAMVPTAPREEPSADEPPPSGKSGSVGRPAAWALSVAAAGALGFGVYETVVWAKKKDEFDNHRKVIPGQPSPHDCGTSLIGRGGGECQSLFDAAAHARTLFMVGYAVGGALAAGAAVLFVVSSAPADSESHAFACAPAGNLMGAACRMSF